MIKILPKTVADKIAAGEVIERPVSIVKELIENSIDAGSTSIIIEFQKGGKAYIRVTDNGSGIASDDVEKAFLRHATSKIETASDLNSIKTLGFRGEALASICAVSQTELITKSKESKTGTRVLVHGGEIIENAATGCPDGTTIIVSNIFYNTPARLKFMKSDAAESSVIIQLVSEIALAYPSIKFRLINNGNVIFSTSGDGNGIKTILSVFKQQDYSQLIELDCTEYGNRVYGYISRPSLTRTTRKDQLFYVNGRVVNSKVIEKGISEGYKQRMFEGRFPIAFLFIETDPSTLDVNIHPNKREIRFHNDQIIINLVEKTIKSVLNTENAVTSVSNIFKSKKKTYDFSSSSENGKSCVSESQVDINQILSNKRNLEVEKTVANNQEKPHAYSDNTFLNKHDLVESSPKDNSDSVIDRKQHSILIDAPSFKPFDFNKLTMTGSIFGTYITATDSDAFYLIDQHAAHERIFYEKLIKEYTCSEKLRQPILTPILFEVTPSIKTEEDTWINNLERMGFTIESFGQNSYIIKEIPTFMELSEAEEFVKVFTENIEDSGNIGNTVVIDKLITKSCKSAVKAHDYLKDEEISALISQLKDCINPFSCPHGRPTFIKLELYQIERMFKRV